MNETLKGILCEMGLPYDSSDEAAQAFFEALNDDLKAEVQSKLEARAAAAQTEADQAAKEAGGSASMSDADKQKRTIALGAAKAAAAKVPTRTQVVTDEGDKVIKLESQRVAQINMLGSTLKVPADVIQLSVAHGEDVIGAKARFLKHLTEACKPITGVRVGDDKGMKAMLEAVPDALRMRAGITVEKPHELASTKLRFMTMVDMYKSHLCAAGVPSEEVMSIPRSKMAEMILCPPRLQQAYPQIFAQLAQGSSSFANLTLDAMGKTLRQAYLDTPTTWQNWCRRETAPDFKSQKFISLSDAPGLTAKTEGKPIDYSVMTDGKEAATLVRYASGIILTAEAIINDDLRAFGRIPMAQGGAAKRLEDDAAYGILTANANLADAGALFNSTAVTSSGGHANLVSVTAAIGAPTVATVAGTEKLMLLQKGPKGAYLKIQPSYIITPVALKAVADQLFGSMVDPAKYNSAINPYSGRLTVISDPRLDANSSVIWYLAADPSKSNIDTVVLVFLADTPEPVLKQETVFDTEDAKFAVIHNLVAKAVDWRGLASNPGA